MNVSILKIFFRVLLKTRVLSMINLTGLSLGISACMFIILYVDDELSFDSQHTNIENVFRITTKFVSESSIDHTAVSSAPLASELKNNYKEVIESVRFIESRNATIQSGNNLYKEKNVYRADPTVFSVFSYKILSGNSTHALAGPHRVVLTRSMAKKYFGTEEPLGKALEINKQNYEVTAVIEDLPSNSDLYFDVLLSMEDNDDPDGWFDFSYYTYVLFHPGIAKDETFPRSFENEINKLADDRVNRPLRENHQPITASLHLQPLPGLHFEPALLYDTPKGNKNQIYIFSLTALFLLLVACLNYINFSIVQSIRRTAEVGIRKVMGATFRQLLIRYAAESVFTTFLAILISLVIISLSLPILNDLTGKQFDFTNVTAIANLKYYLFILCFVGILAGSYPAFYLSSVNPVMALKGKSSTPKGQVIRNVSISAQFMISLGLIICTCITFRQMSFVKNYDLGFKKNNVVVINLPVDSIVASNARVLRENLLKNSVVEQSTICGLGSLPGADIERGSVTLVADGKKDVKMVNYCSIDDNYLPLLNIVLKEGRNFEAMRPSDAKNAVIVNESLVRLMEWDNPLQHRILAFGKDMQIIGVIRDFNYKSLYNKIEPQVLFYNDGKYANVLVSFSKETPISKQIPFLQEEWIKIFADEPFVYHFLDESLAAQYSNEEKAMELFTGFSILTIIISCLGLYGLSSLAVYQRKKEIGIRKIVGADFTSMILLLSRGYLGLIILSFILITPVTWFLMSRWLETFPYRQPIEISLYLAVGAISILIALLTIVCSSAKLIRSSCVKLIGD